MLANIIYFPYIVWYYATVFALYVYPTPTLRQFAWRHFAIGDPTWI